jgi:hypothetical protein
VGNRSGIRTSAPGDASRARPPLVRGPPPDRGPRPVDRRLAGRDGRLRPRRCAASSGRWRSPRWTRTRTR